MKSIVTSTQISQWFTSTSRDAQELLPHLIRKLILSTLPIDKLPYLGIAAGDDIRGRGYDGQVHSATEHPIVPHGISVWEMGTGESPETKFKEDYTKRTRDPQGPTTPPFHGAGALINRIQGRLEMNAMAVLHQAAPTT
jgi:hypothetical protein